MNWRDRLKRLLALHCEEASLLASQEQDESLATHDRLALWGHILVCRSCRRFRRHLRWIGEACRWREAHRSDSGSASERLSPDSRRRIAEALRRASDCDPTEKNCC